MEISSRKIGLVLFIDLCNGLNSLTFEFWFVSCTSIQQYTIKGNRRWYVWPKLKDSHLLLNYYMGTTIESDFKVWFHCKTRWNRMKTGPIETKRQFKKPAVTNGYIDYLSVVLFCQWWPLSSKQSIRPRCIWIRKVRHRSVCTKELDWVWS